MTSRMLLGAGAQTPAWQPPSASGGPSGSSAAPKVPTLTDTTAMSLRPDLPALAVIPVGPTREYTTLSSALERAGKLQAAATSASGRAVLGTIGDPEWARRRDLRVDIVMDPGVYPETASGGRLGLGQHIAIYAADGAKATSVTVNVGFDYAVGWNYVEGIELAPPVNSAKYPVHQEQNGVSIYSRCRFTASLATDPNYSGSGMPIGMDGGSAANITLYDCDLTAAPGGTFRTAFHTWPQGDASRPMQVCLVKTRFPGGGFVADTLNSDVADEFWVVDCVGGWAGVSAAQQQFHISPGTVLDRPGWADGGRIATPTDTRSDWPIPKGQLTDYWRAYLAKAA